MHTSLWEFSAEPREERSPREPPDLVLGECCNLVELSLIARERVRQLGVGVRQLVVGTLQLGLRTGGAGSWKGRWHKAQGGWWLGGAGHG